MQVFRVLGFVWLCLGCGHLMAFDPSLKWKTITSEHFEVHFDESNRAIAEKTISMSEGIHRKLSQKLNWTPIQKTQLVLTDHVDDANGYATALPYNRSVLFVHPPRAGEMDFSNWLESLLTHEYTHVLHLDKAHNIPKGLRNVVGRFPGLFPNIFQPAWLIEGFATYQETDHLQRIGRGQSTWFAMMIKEELAHDFKSIDELNALSQSWPFNARYLYGYYFFEFLQQSYGDNKVQQFIENYSDNWFPYLLNTNADTSFGKNMDELWHEFEQYLRAKFDLSKHHHPESLTKDGFSKFDIDMATNGDVYLVQSDGVHQPFLVKMNADGSKPLTEIHYSAQIDYHPEQGVLIAQPENCDEHTVFSDLYLYQESTQSLTRLTYCARYTEAVWSPDGKAIYAIKAQGGLFQLDKLDQQGTYLETLWRDSQGDIISHLAASSDGLWLAVSVQTAHQSRANLKVFSLRNNRFEYSLEEFAHHWYPEFSQDNRTLSFSREDHGFKLYLWDFKSGEVTQLTDSDTALFQHRIQSDGQITAIGYSQWGFDVYKPKRIVAAASRLNLLAEKPTRLTMDYPTVETSITDYSPWQSLSPRWWFPFAVGNKNTFEIGAQTDGLDALENHFYTLALSLEVERQLPNVFASYLYNQQWQIQMEYFHDIEADKDDSTSDLVIRRQLAEVSYHVPVTRMLSQWDFSLAVSFDKTQNGIWLDDQLNFVRTFSDSMAGFRMTFNSAKYFPRSISINDGRSVKLTMATSDWLDSDFSGDTALVDWREYWQIYQEQVLAIRMFAASAEEGARAFQVGGDFSEVFFMRPATLLNHRYALRGYPDRTEQLIGRHFRMVSAEWRFPIVHVERSWMSPPIGIDEISGTLFYEGARVFGHTSSNIINASEDISNKIYRSRGVEVLTRMKIFYAIPLDIRLGFAEGLDPVIGERQTYLHFGTSF